MNVIFTVWLMRSDCPSVWKWYVVKNNNVIFKWLKVDFQNAVMNLKSRFDIMIRDKSQFSFCNIANHDEIHFETNQIVRPNVRLTRLKNLFVVENIAFMSFENINRLTMKSMMMIWNGCYGSFRFRNHEAIQNKDTSMPFRNRFETVSIESRFRSVFLIAFWDGTLRCKFEDVD